MGRRMLILHEGARTEDCESGPPGARLLNSPVPLPEDARVVYVLCPAPLYRPIHVLMESAEWPDAPEDGPIPLA